MSTRSTIALEREDGTVIAVYAHWNGYIAGNGKMLFENYNDADKAAELLALGDISSLAETIDCPPGHHFDNRVKGCTVFYGRDRGNAEQEAEEFKNYDEYLADVDYQEFNYIMRQNTWYVLRRNQHLSLLVDQLIMLDI